MREAPKACSSQKHSSLLGLSRRVCSASEKIRVDIRHGSARVGRTAGMSITSCVDGMNSSFKNSLAQFSRVKYLLACRSLRPPVRIACHGDIYKMSKIEILVFHLTPEFRKSWKDYFLFVKLFQLYICDCIVHIHIQFDFSFAIK